MLFQLDYRYDGNGQTGIVVCSKAHAWVKTLFAQCGGLVPPPLNDMEVLAHILIGRIEDMAMETLNPSMEGESTLTSLMEGAQNFTPLQTT
jgi:hypothetical protein